MDDIYNPKQRRGLGGLLVNCLSIAFVLGALIAASGFAAVFANPGLIKAVNPFIPGLNLGAAPTVPPTLGFPTVTNTPEIQLPPTWTPTSTETPTETPTSSPTLEPTATETPVPATATVAASTAATASAAFVVQPGSNVLVANFANDASCAWMGVAGQVFDKNRNPLVGITVHVEGQLAGQLVNQDSVTGSNPKIGPAGYTVNLSDHPIASDKTMWIQLRDTAGLALSDQVYFSTSNQCDKNLVFINWNEMP
ncbi:MAG TPA: hypothetical protein VK449_08290 [Anaerolineales bacterium]|nr:hypothetical protein [Anaerolineales bacterium]